MTDRTWLILENLGAEELVIMRSMDGGHTGDSEGPTLHSYEDVEQFTRELRHAAAHVFPSER